MTRPTRDWNSHPAFLHSDYGSTALRAPTQSLVALPHTVSEQSGPTFGAESVHEFDADLTRNGRNGGEPIGERIIVTGRVTDERGRGLANALVEIWQTNAAGRYIHNADQHDAPLDPNFLGAGRCATDEEGRYSFYTVKPGAYPWGNHTNAWRPNHIHFSLFGPCFASRLITQMYFPGDPLLALDPIFNATPERARNRLVAQFCLSATQPNFALGYVFDINVRGDVETPLETAMETAR